MKTAIAVKFSPGQVKHIFTASEGGRNSVRHERDNALQFEENYDAAARKLCDKMGWAGELVKGWVSDGMRVYVWLTDEAHMTINAHAHVGKGKCKHCGHTGDACTGRKVTA